MKNTVGVSKFVKRQKKGSGKTYTKISFQELASYSEKMIAKNPEQWIWTHNRWK